MSRAFERNLVLEDGTTVDIRVVDERAAISSRHEEGEVIAVFNGDFFLSCTWDDAARIADAFLEAAKDAKYRASGGK